MMIIRLSAQRASFPMACGAQLERHLFRIGNVAAGCHSESAPFFTKDSFITFPLLF